MTNTNRGGGPADEAAAIERELDAAWETYRAALATYLATMTDPEEDDHLLIELPDPDPDGEAGCPPYAQFAAFGDGSKIRAEVSGNYYLLPQYRLDDEDGELFRLLGWAGNDAEGSAEERNWFIEASLDDAPLIADQVAWAMRFNFGVVHPQLLTCRAWGPSAEAVDMLGLATTDDVPADVAVPPTSEDVACAAEPILQQLALVPGDRDDLARMVAQALQEKYKVEPTVDEDGDFVLHHLGQPVWVRVRPDQPAVEIIARVAHNVHSRRATAVELGLLNRDNAWARWTLRERTVWQTLLLPGLPFVPAHLNAMLDLFFEAMSETRDDLALRTGARVA